MLKPRALRRAGLTVGAALLLAVTGCGTDQSDEPAAPQKVRLYGTDGNMQNTFGDEFGDQAGLLEGMKGTAPRTPLSDDFMRRLRSVRPDINDTLYAAETYDAIVISALAAELAKSTDPARIAKQINGVTTGGEQCSSVEVCLKLARKGVDLHYRAVSIRAGGFTDAGEPATANYATLHFGANGHFDEGKTEFVGAGDSSATTTEKPPAPGQSAPPGAQLKFGELLPRTGELSLGYPPMAAGAGLAIREINEAGGVFNRPVLWLEGDDGTDPAVAKATLQKHIDAGVHIVIGSAASGISRELLPDVAAAGIILFSSSNTDAGLSTVDDNGLYFRTAPPDILQSRAIADVILRDGPRKIAIIARDDSYGTGLAGNVRAELERAGFSADRMTTLTYAPPAPNEVVDFDAGAKEVKKFGADAVLVIGFGESAAVIKALAAAGVEFQH